MTPVRFAMGEQKAGEGNRPAIVLPAIISGLICYLPIPCIRGAAFCSAPGLAYRSESLLVLGAILGFLADLLVCFVWFAFVPLSIWEPRESDHPGFTDFLPPGFLKVSHCGGPPNIVKQCVGLVVWTSPMYAIWMRLWHPRITIGKMIGVLVASAIVTILLFCFVYYAVPHSSFWRRPPPLFGYPAAWVSMALFLLMMPCCTSVTMFLIQKTSNAVPVDETEKPR